ncbi:serpin family protein [Paenibacillus sp. P25]|nr:serpin family protein [Paenibacillus sp. P25]
MRLRKSLVVLAAMTVLCGGCSLPDWMPGGSQPISIQSSPGKAKYEPADVDARIVQAGNGFGLRVYGEALKKNGENNVFISPISIAMALAMTYNGAAGSTREAMAKTLQLQGISLDEVNQGYSVIRDLLSHPGPGVQLSVANSLWMRQGTQFREPFVERNRTYFGAETRTLDLSKPSAVSTINQWVKKNTQGKIDGIIQEPIPAEIILYLVNAVYFKGEWTDPFEPSQTKKDRFHPKPGETLAVPFMSRGGSFEHTKEAGFEAIRSPYGDQSVGMWVLLPGEGMGLTELQRRLEAEPDILSKGYAKEPGTIESPKFKLSYSIKLNDALKALGMGPAFASEADFSDMVAPPAKAQISEVLHKTFLEVNEKGTEAAAVTSVGQAGSAPPKKEPFHMKADRPFFLAIQDRKTGTVLFLGSITKPEGG